ncbi:MAG TPA: non-canonical purine NTP diphosphatase [Eudoraea sp.]|nr:non-canonical purine NTP diphosphatase [Eudoraea sp.]
MDLVFATHNANKLKEARLLLPKSINVLSLADIGCREEIPETAPSLEGNAILKATFVTEQYGYPCFADDTGLHVDALEGAPGVYSARYAGPHRNAEDNMDRLLAELRHAGDRSAQFSTVIALNLGSEIKVFRGTVHGEITTKKSGKKGFGYDPVFKPKGFDKTFAELSIPEKNDISHRGKALEQLITYLKNSTPASKHR